MYLQVPAADDGQLAVERHFLDERLGIGLDIAGVLVGVDAEVAKFAAFAAKRNVQIEAQRRAGCRCGFQAARAVGRDAGLPEGERRIVGHEVVTEAGFFLRDFRHGDTLNEKRQ